MMSISDPSIYLLILLGGAFLGAFVQGATGFGSGLIINAFWLHIMEPAYAIPLNVVTSLFISGIPIYKLRKKLMSFINTNDLSNNETIITNLRHYEELQLTLHEINTINNGLNEGITGDFLAINIRQALFHLGSITGEITTDTLLGNIFSKFCIGK